MVDMGMGNNKKIYIGRIVNGSLPIALFYFRRALKHAAIYSKPRFPGFNNETGTGDCPGCPQKCNFHKILSTIMRASGALSKTVT